MRERSILFSGPMVRAILDGRKTQTRRVALSCPEINSYYTFTGLRHGRAYFDLTTKSKKYPLLIPQFGVNSRCGVAGDRLWVRESWARHCDVSGYDCVVYRAGGANAVLCADGGDGDPVGIDRPVEIDETGPPKWTPSIHMPRWASRITLEVTDVRVERLQDITGKDILAEGAVDRPHHIEGLGKCPVSAFDGVCYPDLKSLWAAGWNKLNAKRGYGWAVNPWVWAISFKRV